MSESAAAAAAAAAVRGASVDDVDWTAGLLFIDASLSSNHDCSCALMPEPLRPSI